MDAKLLSPGYLQAFCRALSEPSLDRLLKWKISPHGAFCSDGVSAGWRWRLCHPPRSEWVSQLDSASYLLGWEQSFLCLKTPWQCVSNAGKLKTALWAFSPVSFGLGFFRFGNLKMHRSNMTISSQWRSVFCTLKQRSPTFLAPGASFVEDNFSMDWGKGEEMVSGWFMCITFIMHFICVITTSAPPQIIRW